MKSERANFGSKLGIILASAGSAVGLGNVWRFPSEVGSNGGAAFLIIYFICILLLGMPIMIAEFVIGRKSHSNTATAYRKLAPGTHWQWVGYMGVACGFLILGYYCVVAGWILDYIFEAATLHFSKVDDFAANFQTFVSNPYMPLLWLVIFLLINHFIIVKGVQKGIEKYSKMMMPALFILIVLLAGFSVTMPGASEGLSFLFSPDFSKIDSKVILSAMGQAFFSLSLGMGCLCTYASYFKDDVKLPQTAFSVCVIDTVIAIVAGVIIFPAVFSVGLRPDAGPSLVFITFPNVIQGAFGGTPWFAYVFSVFFYILLAVAALTSVISLHEVATAYLSEAYSMTRKKAALIVTVSCVVMGVFNSLSMGVLADFKIFGLTIFDAFDFLTAKIMLPLGGMLISAFVGWYLDKKFLWEEVTNHAFSPEYLLDGKNLRDMHVIGKIFRLLFFYVCFRVFTFILKYIAPVAIAVIFLNELGMFSFL